MPQLQKDPSTYNRWKEGFLARITSNTSLISAQKIISSINSRKKELTSTKLQKQAGSKKNHI
jgi:hypothetical protein